MKVKIKKLHKDSVIPKYAKNGDAGMDLTAVDCEYDSENGVFVYKTGLAFEIPEGYVGLLFPRSSIYKKSLILSNSVGVLDSGYRGEVMFKFRNRFRYMIYCYLFKSGIYKYFYKKGDRIGQIIILPYPQIEFEEVDKLNGTERGTGGYGSTGK